MVVRLTRDGAIAIVTVDAPPVNAIGQAVRQGVWEALDQIEADATVTAVVLACAGQSFIAGADLKEFGQPAVAPGLPELLTRIDRSSRPWVAALHGAALGGGLEAAMACHARVAAPGTKLGLPEVTLGGIPGAGGTLRLPRLVPPLTALTMIATGKPISAAEAEAAGLVDRVAAGDLLDAAVDMAKALAKALTGRAPGALVDRPCPPLDDPAGFDAAAAKLLAKARGQEAPQAAVAALRNAYAMAPEAALAAERAAYLALRDGPQSAALRHVYRAERATTRDERLTDAAAGPCDRIGVVGGGTMGAGIAVACLLAGKSVAMVERDGAAAAAGQARVAALLDQSAKRGVIGPERYRAALDGFRAQPDYAALSGADLVVEAVFEDLAVKQEVFAQLDAVARPEAVLATNTSYLDVGEIAAATTAPGRVVGLHFFSPAHIMKLIEIVVPPEVSAAALATAVALAKALGKIPVLAGVCDGFIANRIMSAYRREAEYMIEDGAMPWDVDRAMTGFGLPMGVFQMGDLAGLDIAWAMRKRRAATRDPSERYVEIGDRLCEMGRFGRKTGRGYYLYDDSGRGRPDPEVEALLRAASAAKGIPRRAIADDAIMARLLGAMQAEGQAILADGIARSGDDIDVVMVNAYGFPRWRGGPMYMLSQAAAGQAGAAG